MPQTYTFGNDILTIKHYKEPLKVIPKRKGFGYYGTLAGTLDGRGVQCHICGKIFIHLAAHIPQAHKIAVKEYKEKFQLAYNTALTSENYRQITKERTLEWLKTLTPEQKIEYRQKARQKALKWHERRRENGNVQPKQQLETKNKRGTCPDQLIEKLRKCAVELGHTPTKGEFINWCGGQRFTHLLRATFGTWDSSLKAARLKKRAKKNSANHVGERKGLPKGSIIVSDEEMLEQLRIYVETYHKIPTSTDCKRGLIRSEKVYIARFGSLPKARELAGIQKTELKTSYRDKGYKPARMEYEELA